MSLSYDSTSLGGYGVRWVLIIFKLWIAAIFLLANLLTRYCICSWMPFPHGRRYISSIVNLVCMRGILMLMGFIDFQCQTFRFFMRNPKIILRSGFVGIGSHKSIIDYLYYSYMFNPVFVRLVLYKRQDQQQEIMYAPLTFWESLLAAVKWRGFDPIVVSSQKQYLHLAMRKLSLKTLISQCFQELNGPIFIMLPGLNPQQQLAIYPQIAAAAYNNEADFARSLVGLSIKPDQRIQDSELVVGNQLNLIVRLMASFRWLKLSIHSNSFRESSRGRYDGTTLGAFIDKSYEEVGWRVVQKSYQQYLKELDDMKETKIHQE